MTRNIKKFVNIMSNECVFVVREINCTMYMFVFQIHTRKSIFLELRALLSPTTLLEK